MELKIFLLSSVFISLTNVSRLIVETTEGSVGLLARRLDCVMSLIPSVLIYGEDQADESYIAIDKGILIKTGSIVSISVRKAFKGTDLKHMQEEVQREFNQENDRDSNFYLAMRKLEGSFIRRVSEFHNE